MRFSHPLRAGFVSTATAALLAMAACHRRTTPAAHLPILPVAYDLGALDGAQLPDDAEIRRRILAMPIGEVAGRLGAFRYTADSNVTVTQDGKPLVEEHTSTLLLWSAQNDVQLNIQGTSHALELIAVGEKAYVRYDKGHLRSKGRRDVDVAQMLEAATLGLTGALQSAPSGHWASINTQSTAAGAMWRYRLEAGAPNTEQRHQLPSPGALVSPGALALPTPIDWPQLAQSHQANATIEVDQGKGVVMRSHVAVHFELPAPEGPPLLVAIDHSHRIRDVGRSVVIAEPTGAVAEYRRPLRPREPLRPIKMPFGNPNEALPGPTAR